MAVNDNRNRYLPLILFILLGGILVGSKLPIAEIEYVEIESGCQKYFTDEDNDGASGFIEDTSCHEYPYEDGLGEFNTPTNAMGLSNNYQPYFDLTVDFVRGFIDQECNNNLNGCIGTNFQNEVQFYCFFSNNIMIQNFGQIFDKFFNVAQTLPNDGSLSAYMNTCNNFQNPPTTLPIIEHQESNNIPENPGGQSGFKGGMK